MKSLKAQDLNAPNSEAAQSSTESAAASPFISSTGPSTTSKATSENGVFKPEDYHSLKELAAAAAAYYERQFILKTLELTHGNKSKAARQMAVTRKLCCANQRTQHQRLMDPSYLFAFAENFDFDPFVVVCLLFGWNDNTQNAVLEDGLYLGLVELVGGDIVFFACQCPSS